MAKPAAELDKTSEPEVPVNDSLQFANLRKQISVLFPTTWGTLVEANIHLGRPQVIESEPRPMRRTTLLMIQLQLKAVHA